METELELLKAIRSGDRKAMGRLYERFAGHAAAIGRRYVSDEDAVCDVIQDSFVKVLTSLDHFAYRGEGSLKAWVMRITANRALDYVKEHERFLFTDIIPDEPDDPEVPVERVPPDVLTRLIAQLPAGYRMVLNLYVFEQRSHKEIAQLLGIKTESSASQFSRARRQLGKLINEYLTTGKQ